MIGQLFFSIVLRGFSSTVFSSVSCRVLIGTEYRPILSRRFGIFSSVQRISVTGVFGASFVSIVDVELSVYLFVFRRRN